jgi:hypothetical protein
MRHLALAARVTLWLAGMMAVATVVLFLFAPPAGAVVSGAFGQQQRAKPTIKVEPLQYHGGPVLHSSDSYAIYWDPSGSYNSHWMELIDGYMHNVGADSGTLGNVFALNGQYGDAGGGAANKSTFRGGYVDTDEYPTTGNCSEPAAFACLTDAQIQAELQHVIGSGSLPGATGPAVYYLLTPPGVTVCTDGGSASTCSNSTELAGSPHTGICGYHSAINPGSSSPVIYAVQPWVAGDAGLLVESEEPLKTSDVTADVLACQANKSPLQEPNQYSGLDPFGTRYGSGLADVIIGDLSVEQSNVVVDPLLNGWYQTATHAEQADMCQWNFGPSPESATPNPATHAASLSDQAIGGASYYLQWAFNSTGLTSGKGFLCWQGDNLFPHFTAPNPVNSGDVVAFNGDESNITMLANVKGLPADEPYVAPVYGWDFGDGSVVSGAGDASVFHSYRYGGTYNVTLTVTDSGRNTEPFSEEITVVGPPPPAPSSGAATSSSTAAASSSSSSTGSSNNAAKPNAAKVVATQSIVSRSLSSVAKSGLAIRYSVNEQATGRFEVLLASSIARKLGLKGASATGLAQGTPAQTIIAKAILVTTKGGHGTYMLKLSKATATKLRKLHKVSLMIRLVVHNAASPAVTTVLNTVNLSR